MIHPKPARMLGIPLVRNLLSANQSCSECTNQATLSRVFLVKTTCSGTSTESKAHLLETLSTVWREKPHLAREMQVAKFQNHITDIRQINKCSRHMWWRPAQNTDRATKFTSKSILKSEIDTMSLYSRNPLRTQVQVPTLRPEWEQLKKHTSPRSKKWKNARKRPQTLNSNRWLQQSLFNLNSNQDNGRQVQELMVNIFEL